MIHCCRFASFATTCRSPIPIWHPKSEILSSMPYFIYLMSSRRLRRMKYRESYRYCYNWRSRNRTLTEWDIVTHAIFYIFVVYCCVSPHLPPLYLMKYRESYRYWYNWRSRNRTPTEWDNVKHAIFYIFVVYCCMSPHLPPLYLMKYRESYRYFYNWRSRNRTPTEWDIVKHVIF